MKKVEDNMSQNVLTVGWSERLSDAYAKMTAANIRHLVVVDDYGFLRGVISDRDFRKAMDVDRNYMLRKDVSITFDEDAIVRDFMSWPAETVDSKADLKFVAQQMIDKKISAFVITEDDEAAIGIITHEDLLKVLCELLDQKSALKSKLESLLYQPPIGTVVNFLKEVGI